MSHCYDCQHSTRINSGKSAVIWFFFCDRETTAQGVCQSWQSRDEQDGFQSCSASTTATNSHLWEKSGVNR